MGLHRDVWNKTNDLWLSSPTTSFVRQPNAVPVNWTVPQLKRLSHLPFAVLNKPENQDEDAQWERFDKCLSHLIPGARGARIQPKITSGKPRQTPWLKTVIGVFQGFRHWYRSPYYWKGEYPGQNLIIQHNGAEPLPRCVGWIPPPEGMVPNFEPKMTSKKAKFAFLGRF